MTVQHQNQQISTTWKDERATTSTSISSLLNDKPLTQQQEHHTHAPTSNAPNEQDITNNKTTVDKPFVCSQCDQSFSRSHNLKSHLATHSPEKPFQVKFSLDYIN
jgi:uncharacterized Zn-finger protein